MPHTGAMDFYDLLALSAVPAVVAVIYVTWRLLNRRRISGGGLVLAGLTVLLAGWVGYFAHYGQIDTHSKFAVVDIAGTRSEVGFEWDGWHLYVSTNGGDPATHVLF